jgi:hypothetical protein
MRLDIFQAFICQVNNCELDARTQKQHSYPTPELSCGREADINCSDLLYEYQLELLMDEYGMSQLDDAPRLAKKIKDGENIIFRFSEDGISAYVICIAPRLKTIGTLPFGGVAARDYGIGVLYRGFFHFDLSKEQLFPNYVGEKLGLSNEDAESVTAILNAIGDELEVV